MSQPQPLTDAVLDEIEDLAKSNAGETYRGPLFALVAEVRRLRGIILEGTQRGVGRAESHEWEAT